MACPIWVTVICNSKVYRKSRAHSHPCGLNRICHWLCSCILSSVTINFGVQFCAIMLAALLSSASSESQSSPYKGHPYDYQVLLKNMGQPLLKKITTCSLWPSFSKRYKDVAVSWWWEIMMRNCLQIEKWYSHSTVKIFVIIQLHFNYAFREVENRYKTPTFKFASVPARRARCLLANGNGLSNPSKRISFACGGR